jgi:hypothetical protein
MALAARYIPMRGAAMASILFALIVILASYFPQQSRSEKPKVPVITIERTGGYLGVDDQVSLFAFIPLPLYPFTPYPLD